MNDNGSKTSRKSKTDDRPWWHSGSKCVAMLTWAFTLAVAWWGGFGSDHWTWASVILLVLGLTLSVAISGISLTLENRE